MLSESPADEGLARATLRRLAVAAVLAVVLGFVMQGVVLGLTLARPAGAGSVAAGLVGGVTWSVLICAGVALGTAIAQGRPFLAGIVGLLVAPAALGLSKAAQKVMAGWLGAASSPALVPLATVSVLRAVEYGLLGWLLGRLVSRGEGEAWRYMGAGAVAGIVFGGAIAALTWRAAQVAGAPLTDARVAAVVLNEVVFPVGCAAVIYASQLVGRSLRALGPA